MTSTTSRTFVSPGCVSQSAPAAPQQFTRVIHVMFQTLHSVPEPQKTFARFSIECDDKEIFSESTTFGPNMIAEMCLTTSPQNVSPVLDFSEGNTYQFRASARVPCVVKIRMQHS